MRRAGIWLLALAVSAAVALRAAGAEEGPSASAMAPVVVATIDGAIGPATADHVQRALARAEAEHAQLFVLRMDTPGGLDSAMRGIIKAILASPIPVAGYVAPTGSRAASAGTYILYASHLAAMAPATNLGAATPIAIGLPTPGGRGGVPEAPAPRGSASAASGDGAAAEAEHGGDAMAAKRVNDASAYIRGLAQLRGRNAEWAEQAVRRAVSLSATEALQRHVVDLIATDVPDLLRQLDGRTVPLAAGSVKLATAHAPVVTIEADWRTRLLSAVSDPSLALILMLVGIYGLVFEFSNPGFVLPGVVGAISLLLALFGLQMLPVNYVGLALIVLGIGCLIAEAFLPTFGALGVGGMVAFAAGAVMLVDTDVPGFGIPLGLVAVLTLFSAAFILTVATLAAKAHRRPLRNTTRSSHGPPLIGATGELVEYAGGVGWMTIGGEVWRVHGDAGLHAGERVRVTAMRGSALDVVAEAAAPHHHTKGATT